MKPKTRRQYPAIARSPAHRQILQLHHVPELGFATKLAPRLRQSQFCTPNHRHQELQIIHAEELDPPEGRTPVIWKLITNLPVATHADAVHKLEWYALRWKIETFFRTLKTGCRIEELRLATAERLANCIALCCVVAWRVSWLAMLSEKRAKVGDARRGGISWRCLDAVNSQPRKGYATCTTIPSPDCPIHRVSLPMR
ncbi:transposase [Cereibacter changlensis]|uniref:transposase n=1 Tax=Cereibacter changlensis TaxID=402884 RepID=UPI004033B347